MFIGSLMYQKRKLLKLTQTELSEGICTQNTITKIEKRNTPPTVNILLQLCIRLGLTLNEVFSEFDSNTVDESAGMLNRLEKQFIFEQPEKDAQELFELVKPDQLSGKSMIQYNFVDAIRSYNLKDYTYALFALDKTLQLTKNNDDNIYTILSNIYKGKIHNKQKLIDQSSFYFDIAANDVQANLNITGASLLQKILIGYSLADFYAGHDTDSAIKFSYMALDLAVKEHSNIFVSQICDVLKKIEDNELSKQFSAISKNLKKLPSLVEEAKAKSLKV